MTLSLGVALCGNVNFKVITIVSEFLFVWMVGWIKLIRWILSLLNCYFLLSQQGEVNVRIGTSFDNKTDQWLGASLAANNDNIIVKISLTCIEFVNDSPIILFKAGTPFLKHRIKDGKNLDYEIPGGALIGKFDKTISMSNNTQIFSPSFFNWCMLASQNFYLFRCVYQPFRFEKLQSRRLRWIWISSIP